MSIVDAQVHVFSPETPEHPWADPVNGRGHRFGSLSAEELLAEMDLAGVDRAVLVPPAFEGDRNELALAAAAAYPDRFGVVARLALEHPAGRALAARWRDVDGLLGVRVTFTREKRGWLRDGTADWLWPAAGAAEVPVMVYAPGAAAELMKVATRHPALRMAVDHCAFEGVLGPEELARETDALLRLSDLPNVAVKASALPAFVDAPFPFPSLHEPLRSIVSAFGAERVFWGSDMTRLPCTYADAAGFIPVIDGLSASDVDWVMGRAVERWLGWPGLD
jgi:predicted TIM-barrel fold metal-dependent hydrolase